MGQILEDVHLHQECCVEIILRLRLLIVYLILIILQEPFFADGESSFTIVIRKNRLSKTG